MRNWSVCTPSTFTRRTASELTTIPRPKPLLLSSGLFQESSILDILGTLRVCSISLPTDSTNLCSLLQEYHPIFSTGFRAIVFAARPAHREPSWTRSRSSNWGLSHKASQLYFDFTQISSSLFRFFQRSDDTARFRDSGAQRRLGRVFVFFNAPTETRVRLLSTNNIYSNRLVRVLSVGLPVRLFACLSVQVCLVLCFLVFSQYSDETRVILSTRFTYYSLPEQIRFSVEWSP